MVCNSLGRPNGTTVRSWLDLAQLVPRDPSTLIEWAKLDTVVGELKQSSTFINPAGGGNWVADGTSLSGNPLCLALETTNALRVAEAEQWNFQHRTRNAGPLSSRMRPCGIPEGRKEIQR